MGGKSGKDWFFYDTTPLWNLWTSLMYILSFDGEKFVSTLRRNLQQGGQCLFGIKKVECVEWKKIKER